MNARLRIRRLEQAASPPRDARQFVIRERDGDVDAQIERLRRDEGMTDDDNLIIIRRLIVSPSAD